MCRPNDLCIVVKKFKLGFN